MQLKPSSFTTKDINYFIEYWNNVQESVNNKEFRVEYASQFSECGKAFEDLAYKMQFVNDSNDLNSTITNVNNNLPKQSMSASKFYDVAIKEYDSGSFNQALELCFTVYTKVIEENDQSVEVDKIYERIISSYYQLGDLYHAYDFAKEWATIDPDSSIPRQYMNWLEEQSEGQQIEPDHIRINSVEYQESYNDHNKDHITSVCGKDAHFKRKESIIRKLTCSYVSDPKISILRYKKEMLNLKPRIEIVHDVANDWQIQSMKILSTAKFVGRNYVDGVFYDDSSHHDNQFNLSNLTSYDNEAIYNLKGQIANILGYTDFKFQPIQLWQYNSQALVFNNEVSDATVNPHTHGSWILSMNDRVEDNIILSSYLGIRVSPPKGSVIYWESMVASQDFYEKYYLMICPGRQTSSWAAAYSFTKF